MRSQLQLLAVFWSLATFASPAPAQKNDHPLVPDKIMEANSVYVDCVCPRGLSVAQSTAVEQVKFWGRFQLSNNRHESDLIFLFSGNPYRGDYFTRDGSDTRYVAITTTIMTIIDGTTGKSLWTDSRHWGSWRVKGATKDMIDELRRQMEAQTIRLTLDDILMCSATPVYAGFGHLTEQEALAKSDSGAAQVAAAGNRLTLTSADAPPFCKQAQFVVASDRRISGFQVAVPRADELDINEVLQHADRFSFSGGKFADAGQTYFTARSKDNKLLIEFDVENHRAVLSRVSYFY
jgi:hypothetical protein